MRVLFCKVILLWKLLMPLSCQVLKLVSWLFGIVWSSQLILDERSPCSHLKLRVDIHIISSSPPHSSKAWEASAQIIYSNERLTELFKAPSQALKFCAIVQLYDYNTFGFCGPVCSNIPLLKYMSLVLQSLFIIFNPGSSGFVLFYFEYI